MLAQVLALAVAIGSIAIYLAAFFFPEVHRKNDFIWSGVGLFYGLVLWVFARRITGGLLLGHVASVALLGWFGWQTMSLRRQIVPQAQQTSIPGSAEVQATIEEQVTKVSIGERIGGLTSSLGGIFAGMKKKSATTQTEATNSTILDKAAIDVIATADESILTEEEPAEEITSTETESTAEITLEETAVDSGETELQTPAPEQPQEVGTETTETQVEAIPSNPPSGELEGTQTETELQTPPDTEEIAPDAESAPPGELPTEQKPPNTSGEG